MDFAKGYIDIHTHILPGVDDGALSTAEALAMVKMAYETGTRGLVLTPHDGGRFKQNDLERSFRAYCREVEREVPGMKLFLGRELFLETEVPAALAERQEWTINRSRYCLVEFYPSAPRSWIVTGVWEMVRSGYIPIIAHPERYGAFRRDKALIDEVLQMGALIQLNAGSIMGRGSYRTTLFCNRLLKARKVHFVASDAHNLTNRSPRLEECWKKVSKRWGKEYARQLFYENARQMLAGE